MPSLLNTLSGIGEPAAFPLAIPSCFGGRTGSSLRNAMDGMTDPHVAQWNKVGTALQSENTSLSEEAQGAATDGALWYVCSNSLKKVVAFGEGAERVATFEPNEEVRRQMGRGGDLHFGAPGYFDGWLYVPTQHPFGVWKFRVDGTDQLWLRAPEPAEDDNLFAWCAVHPITRVLYTCSYDSPTHLYAYDRKTLFHLDDDIPIESPVRLSLDHVQGGVFTAHGRIILVRSDYNAVFCHSSLNGHCFGAKELGDFGSNLSEVESVAVRAWQFSGNPTQVHILELDNDWPDKDDFYLHSFQVPDATTL